MEKLCPARLLEVRGLLREMCGPFAYLAMRNLIKCNIVFLAYVYMGACTNHVGFLACISSSEGKETLNQFTGFHES